MPWYKKIAKNPRRSIVSWFINLDHMENMICPDCSCTFVLGPYKRERNNEYSADPRVSNALDFYCTGCYKRFEVMV